MVLGPTRGFGSVTTAMPATNDDHDGCDRHVPSAWRRDSGSGVSGQRSRTSDRAGCLEHEEYRLLLEQLENIRAEAAQWRDAAMRVAERGAKETVLCTQASTVSVADSCRRLVIAADELSQAANVLNEEVAGVHRRLCEVAILVERQHSVSTTNRRQAAGLWASTAAGEESFHPEGTQHSKSDSRHLDKRLQCEQHQTVLPIAIHLKFTSMLRLRQRKYTNMQ